MAVRHSGPPSNVSTLGVKVVFLRGDTIYYWSLNEKDQKNNFTTFRKRMKGKNATVESVEKVTRKKTILCYNN
jgi:hypothetical protein